MIGSDLLLGFFLSKLFDNRSPAARTPPAAPPPGSPSLPPAALPAPSSSPSSPTASAPAPAPSFPTQVNVPPPTTSSKGFKKAVEVWQVRPDIQNLQASPFVVGLVGAVNDATALAALEGHFPAGWQPCKVVTQAERNMAIALIAKWQDGNVVFLGRATIAGRRAFRMTKHPADAVPPQPQPVGPAAPPAPPAPPAPASAPAPATPAPTAVPSVPVPAPTAVPSAAPPAAPLTTTVRKGEGLAQVAKRLEQPESQASATALRAANLPAGPGGVAYTKLNLSEGGLRRSDRKSGGLQPGDPLFVPASWGAVDPSRL